MSKPILSQIEEVPDKSDEMNALVVPIESLSNSQRFSSPRAESRARGSSTSRTDRAFTSTCRLEDNTCSATHGGVVAAEPAYDGSWGACGHVVYAVVIPTATPSSPSLSTSLSTPNATYALGQATLHTTSLFDRYVAKARGIARAASLSSGPLACRVEARRSRSAATRRGVRCLLRPWHLQRQPREPPAAQRADHHPGTDVIEEEMRMLAHLDWAVCVPTPIPS